MRVETKTPKKGDRVRVTYEGEYNYLAKFSQDYHVVVTGGLPHSVPVDATIEILKPEPEEGDWGATVLYGRPAYVRFKDGQWESPGGDIKLHKSLANPL